MCTFHGDPVVHNNSFVMHMTIITCVFICASHVLIVDVMPVDTNMIAVSWRVRYSDASLTSHFAIFDINRWYHAQMPKQVR